MKLLLATLASLLVAFVLGQTCPPGNQVCNDRTTGPRCYSPTTHQCCENRLLCGKNDGCCGNICYNPVNYCCVNSALVAKANCPNPTPSPPPAPSPPPVPSPPSTPCTRCGPNDRCCPDARLGPTCYNPSTHDCCENRLLCAAGSRCCGNACYDPSRYTCTNGAVTALPSNPAPPPPPPQQPQFCCDSYACGEKIYCPTGMSCCLTRPVWGEYIGGYCYNPSNSTCSYCPVYNPNHPQTTICPLSTPTCCAEGCTNIQCCHHYGTYDSFSCANSTICCGFDNGNHQCCDSATQMCQNDICVPKA